MACVRHEFHQVVFIPFAS